MKEIREEVLNPFPIEVLSQALYPFLKYSVAEPEEQSWMQKNWPLGPIDIPESVFAASGAGSRQRAGRARITPLPGTVPSGRRWDRG